MKSRTSLLLALLVGTGAASAAVVATEDFNYADTTDIAGANGGTGWSSAWAYDNGNTTSKWTVSSNQSIFHGNGVSGIVDYSRDLSSAILVTPTTTVTISVDVIIGNGSGDANLGRGVGITLTSGGSDVLFFGKKINGAIGAFSAINGTQYETTSGASLGTTYSISATLSYDGSDTTMEYSEVNNNGTNVFTHVFTGQQLGFDAVQLSGYHGSTTSNGADTITIDVTTVPEPSAAALFGAFGLLGLLRRRRG